MLDLITLAAAKAISGSGGVTPEQMAAAIQTAIGTALTDYYDKNEIDSELAGYTPSENVGADIAVSMDSSYNLTVSLKNAVGDALGEDEVNLPLESMVVDGSYDDGVLTLTLKNGSPIDIPISDIVDGLVSESRTIAGLPLTSDIASSALQNALGVPSGGAEKKGVYLDFEIDEDGEITPVGKTIHAAYNEIYNAWDDGEKNILVRLATPNGDILSLQVIMKTGDDAFLFEGTFQTNILAFVVTEEVIVPVLNTDILTSDNVSFDIPQTITDDETEEKAPTVQAALDYFQQKITSSNKLPYANISGTPTNLVTGYNNTAYTMRPITQADYNALGTKDSHTLYLITG